MINPPLYIKIGFENYLEMFIVNYCCAINDGFLSLPNLAPPSSKLHLTSYNLSGIQIPDVFFSLVIIARQIITGANLFFNNGTLCKFSNHVQLCAFL